MTSNISVKLFPFFNAFSDETRFLRLTSWLRQFFLISTHTHTTIFTFRNAISKVKTQNDESFIHWNKTFLRNAYFIQLFKWIRFPVEFRYIYKLINQKPVSFLVVWTVYCSFCLLLLCIDFLVMNSMENL